MSNSSFNLDQFEKCGNFGFSRACFWQFQGSWKKSSLGSKFLTFPELNGTDRRTFRLETSRSQIWGTIECSNLDNGFIQANPLHENWKMTGLCHAHLVSVSRQLKRFSISVAVFRCCFSCTCLCNNQNHFSLTDLNTVGNCGIQKHHDGE